MTESGGTRLLSIIIPVKNQARTLNELLKSLSSQQQPPGWDVEIICVDNGSTDATPGVIARYPVTGIIEATLGPSVARNTGANQARGELFWFIDADAWPVDNDFLVKLVDTADELGEFCGFGGPILLPPSQYYNPIAFADHMVCWSAWSRLRPTGPSDFQPTSFVVPGHLFKLVGGFDTSLRVLEDWDLQTRLRRAGKSADDTEDLPMYFIRSLPVNHSARSSLWRSFSHSWYWGLPSKEAWLGRGSQVVSRRLDRPALRWLELPRLFINRLRGPLFVAWHESRPRTLLSLPFLLATVLVWSVALIVGKGQPSPDRAAPV